MFDSRGRLSGKCKFFTHTSLISPFILFIFHYFVAFFAIMRCDAEQKYKT